MPLSKRAFMLRPSYCVLQELKEVASVAYRQRKLLPFIKGAAINDEDSELEESPTEARIEPEPQQMGTRA